MSTNRVKLSHRLIESIKPPKAGRLAYADIEVPPLNLRVSATGVRSFSVVLKQRNGRTVRTTLGRYPQWSLEAARREARRLAGEVAAGVDVQARRRAERAMLTLGELFETYKADRIAAGKLRVDNSVGTF